MTDQEIKKAIERSPVYILRPSYGNSCYEKLTEEQKAIDKYIAQAVRKAIVGGEK